ncbi:hypothetical protein OW495_05375 [Vibrio sp. 14N.309.X.WAT.E.F5]|uniref:hypothetical protein n=1 Tax=Vibrio sp. 14N.309.X.WAT.E.F5 TaxID=2998321 RepID=UPI0025AF45E7|nr:hypothetical protein [Vibrio sp. 14N.309.X.WAT.E.F5]MDN2666138.1 hypothetical protein [Vibrio sp. 14N.309.X.WAT.E.F5]
MEVFGSLATIVGLMCNFKSERRSTSDDEYKQFIDWLDTKRHKSLIEELNSNHLLGLSIKSLLNQNHEVVVQKLSALDGSLIQLASRIDGISEIAKAISPSSELSIQAVDVLKQFNEAGNVKLYEVLRLGDPIYLLLNNLNYSKLCDAKYVSDDWGNSISFKEPRFIEDDLNHLCKLGFLIEEKGHHHIKRVYSLKRAAVSYLSQIGTL